MSQITSLAVERIGWRLTRSRDGLDRDRLLHRGANLGELVQMKNGIACAQAHDAAYLIRHIDDGGRTIDSAQASDRIAVDSIPAQC